MIREIFDYSFNARSNAEATMNGITVSLRDQNKAWDVLSNRIPLVGAAISAALMAITEHSRRVNVELKKQADMLGVSFNMYDRMHVALKREGRDVSELNDVLAVMTREKWKIEGGRRSEIAQMLLRNGIIANEKALSKDLAGTMDSLAIAYADAGEEVQRYNQLRFGGAIGPEAAIALQKYGEQLKNNGVEMEAQRAKRETLNRMLATQTDAMHRLGNAWSKLSDTQARTASPAMTMIIQLMTKVTDAVNDGAEALEPYISAFLKFAVHLKSTFIVVLGDAITVIGRMVRALWIMFDAFTGLSRACNVLSTAWNYWIEVAKKYQKELWAISPALAYLVSVIQRAENQEKEGLDGVGKAAKQATDSIKKQMDEMEKYARQDLFGDMINKILHLPDDVVPPLMRALQVQKGIIGSEILGAGYAAINPGGANAGGIGTSAAPASQPQVNITFQGDSSSGIMGMKSNIASLSLKRAMN